jgi:hypothetical protein
VGKNETVRHMFWKESKNSKRDILSAFSVVSAYSVEVVVDKES